MVFGKKKKAVEIPPAPTPVLETKTEGAVKEKSEEEKKLLYVMEAFNNVYSRAMSEPSDSALLFALFGELRLMREEQAALMRELIEAAK